MLNAVTFKLLNARCCLENQPAFPPVLSATFGNPGYIINNEQPVKLDRLWIQNLFIFRFKNKVLKPLQKLLCACRKGPLKSPQNKKDLNPNLNRLFTCVEFA